MSDAKRILDAIGALCSALPGAGECNVYVSMHDCSAGTLRLLADSGGTIDRYESRTEEWNCARLRVGEHTLYAYGPHQLIGYDVADPDAADAALALAEEILS
jgi:hypothetical protein